MHTWTNGNQIALPAIQSAAGRETLIRDNAIARAAACFSILFLCEIIAPHANQSLTFNIEYSAGDRYEGEFKYSLKDGLGTERFSNGDCYVGNY